MLASENSVEGELERLLADSYVAYLKTHGYHWNVVGPMFSSLHALFMTQYSKLALAVDEIAERIRALSASAPGNYAEFLKFTRVQEAISVPVATEMICDLGQGSRPSRGFGLVAGKRHPRLYTTLPLTWVRTELRCTKKTHGC